jgi:hypothetical protein
MIRIVAVLIFSISLFGCDRKPFVEHKIKSEKLSDDCTGMSPSFRVTANFGGERFEFDKCLPENFNDDNVTTTRKGDTVLVSFPSAAGKTAAFRITLDIDSYPNYHVVTVDGESYNISVTGN